MIFRNFLLLACGLVLTLTASAQVIDFETLPNGQTPVAELEISNQFAASFGVSFEMLDPGTGLPNGYYPKLAKANDDSFVAFVTIMPNGVLLTNVPAINQNVGDFFLTSRQGYSRNPHAFRVIYSKPTAEASGVLLDLDGTEFWRVAYGLTNNTTETHYYYSTNFPEASPNAGDGLATPWSISHTNADITSITFYSGELGRRVYGWAFDNFSPYSATQKPTLTVTPAPQGNELTLAALFGTTNQIQYTTNLQATNWLVFTNAVLTNAPVQSYTDSFPTNEPPRRYRAIQLH